MSRTDGIGADSKVASSDGSRIGKRPRIEHDVPQSGQVVAPVTTAEGSAAIAKPRVQQPNPVEPPANRAELPATDTKAITTPKAGPHSVAQTTVQQASMASHEPGAPHDSVARGDAHTERHDHGKTPAHDDHPGHDGESIDTRDAAPPPIVAPSPSGGAPGFAETDVERALPVQIDEPPEVRARRVAEARAQLAQDRTYAIHRVGEFRAHQHQRVAALQQTRPQIDATLEGAERQGAGQIAQAAATQSAAIRAVVASALAQAQGAATAARAQIATTFATTTQAIEATTRTARGQIDASYQQAVAAARASEAHQLATVGQLYSQAENAFHAAATSAGSHAVTVAAGRATEYRSHKIHHDDSFLDGSLTDNRCEAQADAAEKVGQAYRDELGKEGGKQVAQMRQQRPTDEAAVHQVADEARRHLETAHHESLRSLDQGRQRSLAHARQIRDGALAGAAHTLVETQSSLREHERAQLAVVSKQAASHRVALRRQRTTAAAELHKGVDHAARDLGTGVDRAVAELHRAEVPERAALDGTLTQASAATDQQLTSLHNGRAQTHQQVAQMLARGAAAGQQGIAQTGTSAVAAAQQTGGGAAQSLAQGAQTASAQLQQLAQTHQQSTAASVSTTTTGNIGIIKGVDQSYTQLGQNLRLGMQGNADAVRVGLMDTVDHDMGPKITSEAQKAYDQVQPRWKSVLKWVIIIAIVLVVAIVLGPMVIGAVTGLAAGLGASTVVAGVVGTVVGGAIVGAGTAAVTTVVDNGFAGRDLLQGVSTAMAWGALGGALGGGASALLAGPMQGMTALVRYGLQVGVDTALNTGLSALQGNLSWDSFGSGLLMSMIVNGVTSAPRVRGLSEGAMSRGYGAGFDGGVGIGRRLPGAKPSPGPTSISPARLEHVAAGDTSPPTSPNANRWTVQPNGGGHVPGEIIPRANTEGVPHTTTATDPVTGVSIEQFTRPSGMLTDKSLFPPGTSRAHVDAMANEGLLRALTHAPGTRIKPSTHPGGNRKFTATVTAPNGHPIVIEGWFKPNGAGGFEIESVYPSSDLQHGTIPVAGGTGLGGSRNVPAPVYIHLPASPDDRDRRDLGPH